MGTSTNRDENGNTWMLNLNEIKYPVQGKTPYNAPGMTIFKKDKKPQAPIPLESHVK